MSSSEMPWSGGSERKTYLTDSSTAGSAMDDSACGAGSAVGKVVYDVHEVSDVSGTGIDRQSGRPETHLFDPGQALVGAR